MIARLLFLAGLTAGASMVASAAVVAQPLTPLTPQGQSDFERVLSPQADGEALTGVEALFVPEAHLPLPRLLTWNELAMELTAVDHARGPELGFDQLGPHRSSRALAIVHIAMFDAVNAITRKYRTYTGIADASPQASLDMAIAVAARDTLVALFPSQRQKTLDAFLLDTNRIPGPPDSPEKQAGAAVGAAAAQAILAAREDDNWKLPEPTVGTKEEAEADPVNFVYIEAGPGIWQPDPISNIRVALGYNWAKVKPFVIPSAADFRTPPFPSLTSPEYTQMYNEVVALGGDPSKGTKTARKDFETFKGVFWAYDGTPGLCAPPRLYNQLALQALEQNRAEHPVMDDVSDLSRFLAVLNVAMADTAIAAWDSKWHHRVWRPITAIAGTIDDGNPQTALDPFYYPLGAPATNARGPNFTPPFPAYPSGHAAFGGAIFGILRAELGEMTSFTFVSDEYNGLNKGAGDSGVRDFTEVHFARLSDPEWENARSRIWLGIHWQADADAGIDQGNHVAEYIEANAFLPR